MGDWGKVIFLYDFECDYKLEFWREDSETYREKTQGMFVKNYRCDMEEMEYFCMHIMV